MDIQSLTIFVDAAQLGSFAETARKHNRDPSQISRIIANLEDNLQLRLFNRSTRQLSLTDVGERYLARVTPVLEELDFARQEAQLLNQHPSGLIRITASTAFGQVCLIPLIPQFYSAYPDIELELQLTDRNVDLLRENVDIACRLTQTFQSDLVGIRLFDTHYRVCASPDYLKKSGPIYDHSALTEHHCIVMALPQYNSRWRFRDQHNQITEVRIKSRLAVSNALALRDCLLNGIGPGLAADLSPKNHTMTRMRFPVNLNTRRSQNEEETLHRRTDYWRYQSA